MSVVITTNLILELSDLDIRKCTLQFFEKMISENSTFSENDVSGYPIDSKHYVLCFEGGQHWDIWHSNLEKFNDQFDLNYFLVSYIEGDAIYIDINIDDLKVDQLKLSPGRYKKKFWDILESDSFLLEVKNWALTQVNKKYSKKLKLVEIVKEDNFILDISVNTEFEIYEILKKDDVSAFQIFIDKGIDLNHESITLFDDKRFIPGETIAGMIVGLNALNIFKAVFIPERIDSYRYWISPLFLASSNGNGEMISKLIEVGLNPNKKIHGNTVLNDAVFRGYYEVCKALLSSDKCNPNLKDNSSGDEKEDNPLSEAARQGRLDIVNLLLDYDLKKSTIKEAVIVACQNSQEDVALLLLNKISSENKKIKISNYPLEAIVYASENSIRAVIVLILEISSEVINLSVKGYTPLSMACKAGDLNLVKYLIECGADPKCLDKDNFVSFNGKVLSLGNVERDEFFCNPTHPLAEAAVHGNVKVVEYLVSLGVDPRISVLTAETRGSFGYRRFSYDQPAYELAMLTDQNTVLSYLSKIECKLPKPRSEKNVEGDFYSCDLEKNCDCYAFEEAKDLITATWIKSFISNPVRNEVYFHKQPKDQEEIEASISAINKCYRCQIRYGGKDPKIIEKVLPRKCDYKVNEKGNVVENI